MSRGVGVELEGADGDAERGTPADGAVARLDEAQAAGVEAARVPLQAADQLHGGELGRPRDGPTGEGGRQQLAGRGAGEQLGAHGAGHLPELAHLLHLEERRDVDRAGDGDLTEVVSEQVDNHEVLGAVLRVAAEGLGVGVGGGGALHRLGGGHAVVDPDEQFGGQAERPGRGRLREVGEHAVGDGLALEQAPVQLHRVAGEASGDAVGEVDLVGGAGGDGLVHVGDAGRELLLVEVGPDVGKPPLTLLEVHVGAFFARFEPEDRASG